MKIQWLILLFAVFFLPSFWVWGADREVVSILKGQPAPKDGLLIPELRMVEFLTAETQAKECTETMKIKEKGWETMEEVYRVKLAEMVPPKDPWWKSPEFHRWVGFFLGVGVTGLSVYLAHELQ